MPLFATRWLAFALIGVGSVAVAQSAGHQVDDASALIQRAVGHAPTKRCRPKGAAILEDANELKKVLDESTAVIRVAAGLLLPRKQGAAAAKARRQSQDAGAQEKATRTALREQVRELLKHVPGISPAVRGVLTGWVTPQLLELRRSSGPAVQDFIDGVAAMDAMHMTAENLDSKLSQLAATVRQSGYDGLAQNISRAAPLVKKLVRSAQELSSVVGRKAGGAALLHTAANLSKGFEVRRPVSDFFEDLALMVDRQPGDLKRLIPPRAVQLFRELNVSTNERTLPTISEMVVAVGPRLLRGDLRMMDVMPYVSRLLGDLGVAQDVKALPVVLSFLADISSMNQGQEVDKKQVLTRLAQFLGDLNVFDKVGGPLGAVAGLLGDLAHLSEGKGADPRQVIPRFAKLANEMHAFNSTARMSLALTFGQAASFACELSGMRARLPLCGSLAGAASAGPPPASLLSLGRGAPRAARRARAPRRREASERGGEAAGEAWGLVLQAAAARRGRGGPLVLAQREARARPAAEPCGALDALPGEAGEAARAISQLLGGASGAAGERRGLKRKRPTQSAEEKRREPETRAALRGQIVALLGHFPAIPSVARGVIAGHVVPKVMELRRSSEPAARKLIDGLAAIDIESAGHIVRDLGKVSLKGGQGSPSDPSQVGHLLRQVADLSRTSLLRPQVSELLLDLAGHLEAGGQDWTHVVQARAPQLLRALNLSEAAAPRLLAASKELEAAYREGGIAGALPRAARLVEEVGLLGPSARDRLALAVEDTALFLCSLRGMRKHLPLCNAVPVAPAASLALDDGEDEDGGRAARTALRTTALRTTTPKPTWHRKHTAAKPK